MGVRLGGYEVVVTQKPISKMKQAESALIKKWGRKDIDAGGILTNRDPELEAEIWGTP